MLDLTRALIGLSHVHGLGPARMQILREQLGDFTAVWTANPSDWRSVGITEAICDEFAQKKRDIDIDRVWRGMEREGIDILSDEDERYPHLLREIATPPFALYYRGVWPAPDACAIGVVGTRKVTEYGRVVTERLVAPLAQAGVVVVSGLALGVDALAHEATLAARGVTIAVVGSGLDDASLYPSTNRSLGHRIIERGGLIISEFAPGTRPLSYFFPMRNRIIAGMSSGTLVIEADIRSGSLITAGFALDFGREVFAVPGSILSQSSAGPNNLLKMGARAVVSADDVFETLNWERSMKGSDGDVRLVVHGETPDEEVLLQLLVGDPVHLDDLVARSRLDTAVVSSTLLVMEMRGVVKNCGGMKYTKAF